MSSLVRSVFYIIGMLAASLLLWSLLFGVQGREKIWSNVRPVFERQWKVNTLNDGEEFKIVLDSAFDNAKDLSTHN